MSHTSAQSDMLAHLHQATNSMQSNRSGSMSGLAPPPPPPPPPNGFGVPANPPPPPPLAASGPPLLSQQRGSLINHPHSTPGSSSHQRSESSMPSFAPEAIPGSSPNAQNTSGAHSRRSFSMVPIGAGPQVGLTGFAGVGGNSGAAGGTAPALAAIRGELGEIFEQGRTSFMQVKEFKTGSKDAKKHDPDGRLVSMVNRLWYRFGFLLSAKYLGTGTDLQKEAIMVLTILCEMRQTITDVFEYSKSEQGEKVSTIVQRHQWMFTCAKGLEDLVGKLALKLAQESGKNSKVELNTLYIPQLLEAPLQLFEDRLSNYTPEQQQSLFEECSGLKSLRTQIEAYLGTQGLEPALVALFLTEAVGKAVGILLPQKEKRKLFIGSLLSTYSVCRANSWQLLKANHSIDLAKTGAKLGGHTSSASIGGGGGSIGGHSASNSMDVSMQGLSLGGGSSGNSLNVPSAGGGHSRAPSGVNVGAADLLRQQTNSATTTRQLPTEETFKSMYEGLVLTGYFQVPNIDEPVIQKMLVWYDILEGDSHGMPGNMIGKKGALFWEPWSEKKKCSKVKSLDCALPIGDITDILLGKQTKIFQTVLGAKANPGCCVTLVSKGGYSMNFESATKEQLMVWMTNLTKLANASGKKMYEEGQQPQTTTPTAQQQQPVTPNAANTGSPPTLSQYQQQVAAPTSTSSTYGGAPATLSIPASSDAPPLLSSTNSAAAAAAAIVPDVAVAAHIAATTEVNGGWTRCVAPDGNYYYWNERLQQSVWLKPAAFTDESVGHLAPVTTDGTQHQQQQQSVQLDLSY